MDKFEAESDRPTNRKQKIVCVIDLAGRLDPSDRQLILAVLTRNQSFSSISRLVGQPRHRLVRRFRRLVRRLGHPRFQAAIRHQRRLTDRERTLSQRWIFAGRPMRALAAELGVTLHQVRKELRGLSAHLLRLDGEPPVGN